jgi:hypothetical protein
MRCRFVLYTLDMPRPTHYVPVISRPIVAALFHEAKRHRLPMTRFLDRLVRESLRDTPGWQLAQREWPELSSTPTVRDQPVG